MKRYSGTIALAPHLACRSPRHRAFSLIEVVIALGVATFAIVAIAALLPVGLQSSRDTVEESTALNVLSSLVADRRATPSTNFSGIYQLSALTNVVSTTNTFGIGDNGQEIANLSQASYRIVCVFTPPAVGTLNPSVGHFTASWPPLNTNSPACVEVVVSFPQP
jgi:uncharacterized protein (TIGR02598 family)